MQETDKYRFVRTDTDTVCPNCPYQSVAIRISPLKIKRKSSKQWKKNCSWAFWRNKLWMNWNTYTFPVRAGALLLGLCLFCGSAVCLSPGSTPQIIKSVLFLLMYGHFIFYSIISLTIIDAEKSAENTLLVLLEPIYGFLLLLTPVLWLVLFFWSTGGLVLLIRRKFKSEKAQKLKEDFAARTGLQILLLLLIVFGWWEFMKQFFLGFGA